jgi:hypothetical protein
MKGIQVGKEELKLFVFADDMIYQKYPKNSTKKLNIINTFNKEADIKSMYNLYIKNEQIVKEFRNFQ